MNTTDLARYRELSAKAELTDDEFVELEILDIGREHEEEHHRAAMAETYAAIQRDEDHSVYEEYASLSLSGTSI